MRKKVSVLVLSVFILTLLPVISGSAIKPLRGTMDLQYDLDAEWPEEPVWVGTIDIKGYGVYDMRFFHLTPFKEYSQASPFEEYFEIYLGDTIFLAGPDIGVTTLANKPVIITKEINNKNTFFLLMLSTTTT